MSEANTLQSLLNEAWSKRRQGDFLSARSLLEEAREKCDDQDWEALGRIHHVYMQLDLDQDNLKEALSWSRKSLAYYHKSGNLDKIAHCTRHMADIQSRMDLQEEAEKNYLDSISIYRALDTSFPGNLANALLGYGEMLLQIERKTDAIEAWKEAIDLYEACGIQEGVDDLTQRLNSIP